jgi:threonine/homoserine/homoserine lactone efflux protein
VVDPLTLLAFIPAALVLNMTPGADMMFCLGQGLRSGPRAAVMASAGITMGGLVHVTLAGLGLGAVIAAHPWAFDAIRWAGVGYLVFLAIQAFRYTHQTAIAGQNMSNWTAFRTGFLVNLSNPKVLLFVLAFVPQFVVPEAGNILGQFLIFGAVLGIGGFVINGAIGAFAGHFSNGFNKRGRVLGWVSGGIFLALAARIAILERA